MGSKGGKKQPAKILPWEHIGEPSLESRNATAGRYGVWIVDINLVYQARSSKNWHKNLGAKEPVRACGVSTVESELCVLVRSLFSNTSVPPRT